MEYKVTSITDYNHTKNTMYPYNLYKDCGIVKAIGGNCGSKERGHDLGLFLKEFLPPVLFDIVYLKYKKGLPEEEIGTALFGRPFPVKNLLSLATGRLMRAGLSYIPGKKPMIRLPFGLWSTLDANDLYLLPLFLDNENAEGQVPVFVDLSLRTGQSLCSKEWFLFPYNLLHDMRVIPLTEDKEDIIRGIMYAADACLTEEQKEILSLKYKNGMTDGGVCKKTGLSIETVKREQSYICECFRYGCFGQIVYGLYGYEKLLSMERLRMESFGIDKKNIPKEVLYDRLLPVAVFRPKPRPYRGLRKVGITNAGQLCDALRQGKNICRGTGVGNSSIRSLLSMLAQRGFISGTLESYEVLLPESLLIPQETALSRGCTKAEYLFISRNLAGLCHPLTAEERYRFFTPKECYVQAQQRNVMEEKEGNLRADGSYPENLCSDLQIQIRTDDVEDLRDAADYLFSSIPDTKDAQVMFLYYRKGYSISEISDFLQTSVFEVSGSLRRSGDMIKKKPVRDILSYGFSGYRKRKEHLLDESFRFLEDELEEDLALPLYLYPFSARTLKILTKAGFSTVKTLLCHIAEYGFAMDGDERELSKAQKKEIFLILLECGFLSGSIDNPIIRFDDPIS